MCFLLEEIILLTQNFLIDIDIDINIFQIPIIDIDIFKNVFIDMDIDTFNNDLINIDIDIFKKVSLYLQLIWLIDISNTPIDTRAQMIW